MAEYPYPPKERYPHYNPPSDSKGIGAGTPVKTVKPAYDAVFGVAVGETFDLAHALLLKKHKDYGPKNISQSPGGPMNGLRVRMWDKIARLNNLIDSGTEPEYESVKDTLVDLMNYAAIAILVLEKKWPNE